MFICVRVRQGEGEGEERGQEGQAVVVIRVQWSRGRVFFAVFVDNVHTNVAKCKNAVIL